MARRPVRLPVHHLFLPGWMERPIRQPHRVRAGLVVLALGLVPACGPSAPAPGPLVLVDDAGDTVRLARPAVRVVSLIPATTEVLFALGAGDRVVGRTTWCDYPAAAQAVPSLGDGIEPNVELVIEARPDLVVLYRSARNAMAARRLRALAVPTIQLRTDGLDDFRRAVGLLAHATGTGAAGEALLSRFDADLAEAARPAAAGPRVLLLAWDQPPLVVGRASFQHELLELAGGRNLFADLQAPSGPVSLEAIAARDPDLVLVTSETPGIARRPEWQVVRAVRERRFLVVTGSAFARPTPRAPGVVRWLRDALTTAGPR